MIELSSLVRNNIRQLRPYQSARDEFEGQAEVYLDANENPFGQLNRYPDPRQQTLKQTLSERMGIPAARIFLGNGSDEVIDLAIRIFCEPGVDRILTCSPTYGMYEVLAQLNGVEVVDIPLTADFQLDTERILAAPEAKILFLCSPNNPTGNRLQEVETLLEQFPGLVFVDEAYIDFSDQPSYRNRLDQYPRLIVSHTFSKAWGLAAARVGIAYAGEAIIELFNRVKPPYNISRLNQQAVLQALQQPQLFEQNRQTLLEQRRWLETALQELPQVLRVYPSDANFLLVAMREADRTYQYLIERGVLVRNRSSQVPNCLRISVGTPRENQALIQALKHMNL